MCKMTKRIFVVIAGVACLALSPVGALGQQDSSNKMATGSPETTATQASETTSAGESPRSDHHEKTKYKQKKSAGKKPSSKEPTENERIFDEMLRSAASGGM
jgi:hypothetical protein